MINDDLPIALCERNSDRKLIRHQDEDWNETQVRPISEMHVLIIQVLFI